MREKSHQSTGHALDASTAEVHWPVPSQAAMQVALAALPSKDEACSFIEAYYNYATILYQPVPRTQALDQIVGPIFTQDSNFLTPANLSCLYSLLALGAFHDITRTPNFQEASRWLRISQDLLLSNFDNWDYSLASIEALILLALGYLASPTVDAMKAYHIVALAMKSTQMICLYKDPEPGTIGSEELIRRRRIFWELWSLDCATALDFERPPSMLKTFVECELPPEIAEQRSHEAICTHWKYSLTLISQDLLTTVLPSAGNVTYSTIMVLDHKIRGTKPTRLPMDVRPTSPDAKTSEPMDRIRSSVSGGMMQAVLIYLHKPYFAWGMLNGDQSPIAGKAAPSVLACYNSATEIINGAFTCLQEQPLLLGRVGMVWSSYIISTIILYTIAIYTPYWSNAYEAIAQADRAVAGLFEPFTGCLKAQYALPTLKDLQVAAHTAVQNLNQGTWIHPSRMQGSFVVNALPSSGGASSYPQSQEIVMNLFGAPSGGLRNAQLFNAPMPSLPQSQFGHPLSVVGSPEERPISASSPSWDDLLRGIQTARIEPSTYSNSSQSDGSAVPTPKALCQAWPRLMQKLGVLF